MSEWQPIETAPKDGTRVLASVNGEAFVAGWLDYMNAWYIAPSTFLDPPTHWMPLPPPPE